MNERSGLSSAPARREARRGSLVHGLDAAVTFEFPLGDFAAAARAEAQALFFLAAWRRYAAGRLPLSVTCVGDPPDTVLALAERCRAVIEHREPLVLGNGTVFNRALSWMAPGDRDRRVVLGPDVLVLGDFTQVLAGLPSGSLSVAPAEKAQLTDAHWERVYRHLAVPPPADRMKPLRVELGLPVKGALQTFPYYHGAVVVAPCEKHFGRVWVDHCIKLAKLLPGLEGVGPRLGAKLAAGGKVALATVCQAMLAAGTCVQHRLPRECDGRLSYFESADGADSIRLMHASGLFAAVTDLAQIQESLQHYSVLLRSAVAHGVRQRGGGAARARLIAWWRTRGLESNLRWLYRHEVRPTLRHCGAYG